MGDKVSEAQGAKAEDEGKLAAAELSYESNINGVNTNVANIDAQLQQAQFYLDNTTMKAPEDGRIVNLQVRPGMVSGILRIGGIAALIASADRYLLATYIWKANGQGQYLPSDEIPKYEPPPPTVPQGQYAVKIIVDDPDQSKFPIGAQGAAAIYVDGDKGSWAALRKVNTTAVGAVGGAMWGTLVGLIFLMPLLGAAVGAASGAIGGKLTNLGIDDKFMKEVGASLQSGNAALFLLIRKMTTDKVLEDLKGVGGKVLRTSFDHTKEDELRSALADATTAHAATQVPSA